MKIFYKILLGETRCSGNPYFSTGCLSIQFFDSPPFPQHLCDPVLLMGCHATPLVIKCFSPNPLPREAEDFPRSGNHSKHVPLPTYLA